MELRTHAHILRQSVWFFLLVTVASGIAGLLFALLRPTTYDAVVSFDVQFAAQETADYQYGGYYELKAAEIFTQNILSWFLTPAVVAEVYEAAGQPYAIDSIPRFTSRFKAKQYAAQHVVILFSDANPDRARNLANAVVTVVERRTASVGTIGARALFTVSALPSVVAQHEIPIFTTTLAGFVAGALASLVLVYLRVYFREES